MTSRSLFLLCLSVPEIVYFTENPGDRFGHDPGVTRVNLKVGFLVSCRSNHDPEHLQSHLCSHSRYPVYLCQLVSDRREPVAHICDRRQ